MSEQLNESDSHPADDSSNERGSASRPRGRQCVPIPSVDELLRQLIQLNGAVALGAISSKEANVIQKNVKTVLDVQMRRASRDDTGPSQEALAELCRNDPRMLNVIEPFLTDSQMNLIMSEVTDDQDESV